MYPACMINVYGLILRASQPGFEDPNNIDMVYTLHKALYGLREAPRAWYETLKDFLLKKGFKPGTTDPTLCQIYVDDIIFGCSNPEISEEFAKMVN